jgi:hypothetical protein
MTRRSNIVAESFTTVFTIASGAENFWAWEDETEILWEDGTNILTEE